ncbi:MAG: M20/M25/M40 family metallo-hydrolase [Chloroflexi bacterium]|nr:M20/M25/M40 family metallo-hydrolase [Chloroflexota bacterium]
MTTQLEESTDLLQHLIRNQCVNDGTPDSGRESRSADLLTSYLTGPGVEIERYEPHPGRASLVVRIEGSDPKAPSLHLCGHTDVVPVNEAGWQHDPFGGELIDGTVWGRGAVDMLNVTATMATAIKRLITSGFRPKGTIIYTAVADEEALGTWGAEWLVNNKWDLVKSDYMVTEFGGARFGLTKGDGAKLPVMVGEKGSQWTKLRVKGTPGHGSMPFRADNAAVKAGEVLARIGRYRAPTRLQDTWYQFIGGLDLPPLQRFLLTHVSTLQPALDRAPIGIGRFFYATTHTTLSPNIVHSGVKINVIPDTAMVEVDIRTLPGDHGAGVRAMLRDAIGDLWSSCEIISEGDNTPTESPLDTPLWDALAKISADLVPGSKTVPMLLMGATDARFFRRKGVTAYGYGLMSERIPFDDFAGMFHGNDERVDQESLRLCGELWERLAREFCG